MNRPIYYISLSLIFFLSLTFCYWYGEKKINTNLEVLRNNLINDKEKNLNSIVIPLKNYLLQGNIRGIRNILENYRQKGIFNEYAISESGQIIDHSPKYYQEISKLYSLEVPIYFSTGGKEWGKIIFLINHNFIERLSDELKGDLTKGILNLGILFLLIAFVQVTFFYVSLNQIISFVDQKIRKESTPAINIIVLYFWKPLIDRFYGVLSSLDKWKEKIFVAEKIEEMNKISSQVAHDIRSPLAALNMVMRDISSIPEDKRIIIRGSVNRIQDIANDLLAKNRDTKRSEGKHSSGNQEPMTTQLMSSLLDSIITEKRMQFRSKLGIEIEFCSGRNSYGLFANIRPHGFKRVISNLINNSVEALGDSGKVQVELSGRNEEIEIRIKDNGKGIPPEILKKLGQQGQTHGKEEGNGLGLYHAKKSIASWSGKLSIESEVEKGTTLTISIPRAEAPSWFIPELKLAMDGNIVILDDDSTIHQIWDGRFEEARLLELNISVFHFSTVEQIEKWMEDSDSNTEVVYLFDYELIGQKTNGLALIEKLNLAKKAILVTSRYEEKAILEKCQKLGVKLIPKSMAESVPISIKEPLIEVRTSLYDFVYIDDDKYLRMGWENSAKAKGIKLLTLCSTKDFEQHSSLVSRETTFYIDRELGENEPKGEVWAKELFEKGYKNLFLATGYDESYFLPMEWISGFIEKDPPWDSGVY